MLLFEILRSEKHPSYQSLEISNGDRLYDFLKSIVSASIEVGRPFLSQSILRAFNFHAIACLHTNAGEYRPCQVKVGAHVPPEYYRVSALMDDFVNTVNRRWEVTDGVVLASYVLWKLNHIHPFINGNGRTARAAAYFVICVSSGGLLGGERILPQLLKDNREEYVAALVHADQTHLAGELDLRPLHAMMERLLDEQISGKPSDDDANPT